MQTLNWSAAVPAREALAVVEDQQTDWYHTMQSHKLEFTVAVLRMLYQQSNGFVGVERGAAMRSNKANPPRKSHQKKAD